MSPVRLSSGVLYALFTGVDEGMVSAGRVPTPFPHDGV